MKVIFIAKTDLNVDGRVLNQIRILKEELNDNIKIDFILFPDRPFNNGYKDLFDLHLINTHFRSNRVLRLLTVIEFTLKSLYKIIKISPSILHVQDSSVIIPGILYKLVRRKKIVVIYDDHELPNENSSFSKKIFDKLEVLFMRMSNFVLFANSERMEYVQKKFELKTPTDYFLNLPYYPDPSETLTEQEKEIIAEIDELRLTGINFFIHQGVINIDRGEEKLALFASILSPTYKIMIIGPSEQAFDLFVRRYRLDRNCFHFVGKVRYNVLPHFWARGFASIVMYLPTFINNRLCAPNRFFISIDLGLPVFVNNDNPVLVKLIDNFKCGYEIESIDKEFDFKQISSSCFNIRDDFDRIKLEQIKQLLDIYKQLILSAKSINDKSRSNFNS